MLLFAKTVYFHVSSLLNIYKELATHFISENICTVIEVLYSETYTEGLCIGHFMFCRRWGL